VALEREPEAGELHGSAQRDDRERRDVTRGVAPLEIGLLCVGDRDIVAGASRRCNSATRSAPRCAPVSDGGAGLPAGRPPPSPFGPGALLASPRRFL
jgi:hypothetical protein